MSKYLMTHNPTGKHKVIDDKELAHHLVALNGGGLNAKATARAMQAQTQINDGV